MRSAEAQSRLALHHGLYLFVAKVEAAEANLAQAAVGLCVVDRVILRLDVGGPVEVYLGLVIYVADPVKVADSMIVCLGTAVPRTFPPTWAPFLDTRTTRKFGARKVLVQATLSYIIGHQICHHVRQSVSQFRGSQCDPCAHVSPCVHAYAIAHVSRLPPPHPL